MILKSRDARIPRPVTTIAQRPMMMRLATTLGLVRIAMVIASVILTATGFAIPVKSPDVPQRLLRITMHQQPTMTVHVFGLMGYSQD